MKRPEYWEDDETWAAYNEWLAANPPPAENTLEGLRLAIAKARGDIRTEEDMRQAIDCGNKLWAAFKAASKDRSSKQ
jgi:hypothetical protein